MKKTILTIIGLFLFACNFMTPSNSNSETLLVARHPEYWMTNYKIFAAINNTLPLDGRYAKASVEKGRIFYGITWNEPSCPKAISSPISLGTVEVVLYKSIASAKETYSRNEQNYSDPTYFQYTENVNLRTGNTGVISFSQYTSCEITAYSAEIMFRRNNVIGFAVIETFQKNSDADLKPILLDLGSQLDQLIQNEVNENPGNETSIVEVINSAVTIELPSQSNQTTNDSANGTDYFDSNGTNTDEGCIHSIYAPTYKMCDEEYQFLQSQDP